MRKRRSVRARKDKRIFTASAKRTKRINVNPGEWRGGIML